MYASLGIAFSQKKLFKVRTSLQMMSLERGKLGSNTGRNTNKAVVFGILQWSIFPQGEESESNVHPVGALHELDWCLNQVEIITSTSSISKWTPYILSTKSAGNAFWYIRYLRLHSWMFSCPSSSWSSSSAGEHGHSQERGWYGREQVQEHAQQVHLLFIFKFSILNILNMRNKLNMFAMFIQHVLYAHCSRNLTIFLRCQYP